MIGVVAVVNEHRVAEEVLSREKTPMTTIIGSIPVVTHPEDMTVRHDHWSPIPEIGQVFLLVDRINEMRQLPIARSEPLSLVHPDGRIHMPHIWFGYVLTVAEKRVVSHLNSVARDTNQALHYCQNRFLDPLKDNKFSVTRFTNCRRPHIGEWHSGPIESPVNEERVTNM